MKARCVEDDDLLRLVDGELTENGANELREHLNTCAICRARLDDLEKVLDRIKMPLGAVDTAALIEGVMQRLPAADAAPVASSPSRSARFWLLTGLAAAVAGGFLLALPVVHSSFESESGTFFARGKGAPKSATQLVDVSMLRVGGLPAPLRPGEHVRPDEVFAVSYRNLGSQPVYLLAFAVDAKHDVHWICPMYVDKATDPASTTLSPQVPNETYVPPSVQLEGPASGPIQFIAVLSSRAMRVSSVEALRGAELDPVSLRARWPGADVRELGHVIVDASSEAQ